MRATRSSDLRSVDLFAGCTAHELDRIESLMTVIDVAAGTVLMEEGSLGLEVAILLQGQAVVSHHDEVVAVVGPGDLVGEMAVLDHTTRSARVVTLTPCRVAVAHVGEFLGIIDAVPAVRRRVERLAAGRKAANARR